MFFKLAFKCAELLRLFVFRMEVEYRVGENDENLGEAENVEELENEEKQATYESDGILLS